jgi:hypothetical protein
MTRKLRIALIWVALANCGIATAHHSLSAEFDLHKMSTFSGVITRVEWGNPHTWLFIDIMERSTHRRVSWALQLPSPNLFERLGWHREPFQSGVAVIVGGHPAKDGSRKLCVLDLSSTDGKKFYGDRSVSPR